MNTSQRDFYLNKPKNCNTLIGGILNNCNISNNIKNLTINYKKSLRIRSDSNNENNNNSINIKNNNYNVSNKKCKKNVISKKYTNNKISKEKKIKNKINSIIGIGENKIKFIKLMIYVLLLFYVPFENFPLVQNKKKMKFIFSRYQ